MTSSLAWSRQDGRICISGRIDENAELDLLLDELDEDETMLDLGGLVRINSIGVRSWMDFVAESKGVLKVERCPPVFVEQLNAIANFAGKAEIVSVRCAYECDADGEAQLVDILTKDARAQAFPLAPRCPRCGAEMIPAQENDTYFRFLKY